MNTGEPKYGVISQFPTIDSPEDPLDLTHFSSERSFEHFEVGYSKFGLKRYNITIELTTSQRAGLHRYTFPPTENKAKIIIDLPHNLAVYHYSGGWNRGGIYTVYFCSKFNTNATEFTDWEGKTFQDFDGTDDFSEKANGVALTFNVTENPVIISKVGISFISADQACNSVESEIPDWDFEKTKHEAVKAWQTELGKIQVEGGTDELKTIFYTVDIVRSLIDIYKNEGYMHDGRSGISNGITQGGSNGDMVVAETYLKKLGRDIIDWELAYEALIKDAEVDPGSRGLYEGAKGFIIPRYENGSFYTDIDVLIERGGEYVFYEGSSWEYSLDVPFDVKRLIELSGGPKEFESRLDKTFADKSYQSGYYNIGNEPDFFHICLYHFIGKQYKSVEVIRDILKTKFGIGQDGIPAYNLRNEDHINPYVQSVKINDKYWRKTWFRHSDIANGAVMVLIMGPKPSKVWGVIGKNDDKIDIEDRVVPPSMT
ncbi:5382_t:CDS:2 [Racocetra fulgida]|uniref:5382_t:CDS:1 n=1 Tax=Racocetra fulgida TaxID=60492 RepID=A0A9N9ASZ5_9GLOM|nr:5382_t:CDS:2 [Racocetra fulgida]